MKKLFTARNSSGLQSKTLAQQQQTPNTKIKKKKHKKINQPKNPLKSSLKILSQMYKKSSKPVTVELYLMYSSSLPFVVHLENMESFKNRRRYLNDPEQKHCVY